MNMALGAETVIQCYLRSGKGDSKVKRHALGLAWNPD